MYIGAAPYRISARLIHSTAFKMLNEILMQPEFNFWMCQIIYVRVTVNTVINFKIDKKDRQHSP